MFKSHKSMLATRALAAGLITLGALLPVGASPDSNTPKGSPPPGPSRQETQVSPSIAECYSLISRLRSELLSGHADMEDLDAVRSLRIIGDSKYSGLKAGMKALLLDLHDKQPESPLLMEILDALWRLGESTESFRAWVEAWPTQPQLGMGASIMLCRSTEVEDLDLVLEVCERGESAGGDLGHAFWLPRTYATQIRNLRSEYQRAQSVESRVDIASLATLGTFVPLNSPCTGIESSENRCNPLTFISRQWLKELSSSAPHASASALVTCSVGGLRDRLGHLEEGVRESILDDLRDHAAEHLAMQARRFYLEARPQAFTHTAHRR